MKHGLLVAALVLGACGDDGGVHHLADAPPAPDDAPIADAPTSGPVALTIKLSDQPQVGINVYFQAANGALVATKMTDATGTASATMEPGGYVTAVNPFRAPLSFGKGNEVRTFVGVKPGDHLVLDRGAIFLGVTVTAPDDTGAASYEVYSTCGGTQSTPLPTNGSGSMPSGVVSLTGCGSSADFTVLTRDANGGPLHYLTKSGVAITDGVTIDLTGETYAALSDTQLMFSGAPAATTTVTVQYALMSARGPIYAMGTFVGLEVGGGNVTLPRPAGGVLQVADTRLDPPGLSEQHVVDWSAPAATFPIGLASGTVPEYTASPSVDPATHTLTWTAGPGAAPDALLASMFVSRQGSPGISWSWYVSAPYGGTSFVLPKLDVAITQFNVIAGDTVSMDDLLTAKVPGGYDAVRALLQTSDGPQSFIAGASGRIAYTHLNFQVVSRTR